MLFRVKNLVGNSLGSKNQHKNKFFGAILCYFMLTCSLVSCCYSGVYQALHQEGLSVNRAAALDIVAMPYQRVHASLQNPTPSILLV